MDKEEQSKLVPLGNGLAGWSPFTWSIDQEELPYRLTIRVVYEDGRFVVDQLTVKRQPGGPPVTSEGIREVPIGAVLRLAVEHNVMRVGPTIREGNSSSWELTWASPLELSERTRHTGPTERDLQTVADAYHVAYATSQAPTKAVMERLGLPRSTASRWIALARKRGLLGPASPGKAGG
jgi:hypothetical protein